MKPVPFLTRGDLLLLLGVAAASLALFFLHQLPRAAARGGDGLVRVSIAGSGQVGEWLPAGARAARVRGRLGEMVVETAEDGSVRVVSSPCPGQICVGQGWTHAGSSIVCVPNGVVLTPEPPASADGASEPDGITR
ncbi:MAG TPA: NusG domain II-containing protein [Candidatus Ozemobacteraceae bacterium]|nr:NusG domain II-containing protein [Candidatus Ozemobacteraceae bacterium]